MADTNLELRVEHIETKFDSFAKQMSTQISELATAVKDIASRPANIAWREVALTAGAFLSLFWYVDNYVERKASQLAAVDRHRIDRLEVHAARIGSLQAQICVMSPTLCAMAAFGSSVPPTGPTQRQQAAE